MRKYINTNMHWSLEQIARFRQNFGVVGTSVALAAIGWPWHKVVKDKKFKTSTSWKSMETAHELQHYIEDVYHIV